MDVGRIKSLPEPGSYPNPALSLSTFPFPVIEVSMIRILMFIATLGALALLLPK